MRVSTGYETAATPGAGANARANAGANAGAAATPTPLQSPPLTLSAGSGPVVPEPVVPEPPLPPALAACGPDDLSFLSDAARSKVVELVRSISNQLAGGAAGIRRDVSSKARAGTDGGGGERNKHRLRTIWTESLANDISARTYNEASIRISRERREVWVCRPGPSDDPAPKTYRMQEQPRDFETHMKLWEASTRGFDLSIEYLRRSLAKLEEMPDEPAPPPLQPMPVQPMPVPPAPPPLPRRVFGRRQA